MLIFCVLIVDDTFVGESKNIIVYKDCVAKENLSIISPKEEEFIRIRISLCEVYKSLLTVNLDFIRKSEWLGLGLIS